MASPIAMPKQGQSVEVCVINEWTKKQGDTVKEGDVLFTYETDKATFEYESPVAGTLLATFFDEDAEVPVMTNVAVVGEPGEDVEQFRPGESGSGSGGESTESQPQKNADTPQQEGTSAQPAPTPKSVQKNTQSAPAVTQSETGISPRARMRAEERGSVIDSDAKGTGPGGRIIERDVLAMTPGTKTAYARAQQEGLQAPAQGSGIGGRVQRDDLIAPAPSASGVQSDAYKTVKLSNMRKIIADRMHSSLQQTAQLTMHSSADARELLAFRKKIKEKGEQLGIGKISVTDVITYTVSRVLLRHPGLNALFENDEYRQFSHVHLAMAVDTPRGLMVPVVHKADRLSLSTLAVEFKTRIEQCREGSIDPDLLSGGTFTVSNLGTFGVEYFTPILNPPQVALLGINAITPKAVGSEEEGYEIAPHIGLSLTIDHRVVDGAPAARFLKDMVTTLENITLSFCL